MPHSFPRPNDLDWTPKAFVSCVSDEFKAERLAITAWLQRNHVVLDSDDVLPLVQENFPKSTGDDLLSLIHEYIKKSDVVIHLVGVKAGFLNEGKTDYERASAAEITNLRKSLQDEMSKLDPQPVWEELSYTQWEAWLAVLYNRPLFVYDLSKGQVKPVRTIHIDLDRIPDVASKGLASQQNHIGQLIQHRTIGSSSISISEPELSIQTLVQYVASDLSDFIAAVKQQQPVRRIKRAVESLLRDNVPRDPSAVVLEEYLQTENLPREYYGRDWLYKEVYDWAIHGFSAVFWLEAEAGFGKSRFCAELALGWKGKHAIKIGGMCRLQREDTVTEILKSLCSQLSVLAGFRKAMESASESLILERTADWIDHLPELSDGLEPGSDDFEGFRQEFLQALLPRVMGVSLGDSTNILLLIDGLDELLQTKEGKPFHPLEQFLTDLLRSPLPNYRVLLTSRRPGDTQANTRETAFIRQVIERITQSLHDRPIPPDLSAHAPDIEDDVRKFILNKFKFTSDSADCTKLLLERSQGSMLYLHYVANDHLNVADDLRIANDPPRRLLTLGDVQSMPLGLGGYYKQSMQRLFAGGDYENVWQASVKPCLELIAAAEQFAQDSEPTLLSVDSIIACLGKDRVETMRNSLRSLIVESKQDGTTVFRPFHLSFLDWLLKREFEDGRSPKTTSADPGEFQIIAAEGERTLARWACQQYAIRANSGMHPVKNAFGYRTDDPEVHEIRQESFKSDRMEIGSLADTYWVRYGVRHMLGAYKHLHPDKISLIPWLPPKTWDDIPPECERFAYLVRAVDFLGWLKCRAEIEQDDRIKKILSDALPLLQTILALTTESLDDNHPLPKDVLSGLEPVDQIALFELVKDICATDIIEEIIEWIGKTQFAPATWNVLVTRMLELDEWVIRCAAGTGQAARYFRHMSDSSLTQSQKENVIAEIDRLLESADINRREMGVTAVGEIIKVPLRNLQALTPEIDRWLRTLSSPGFDLYFCPTILGDLLIDLTLRGFEAPEQEVILLQLESMDKKGYFEAFWTPPWQYNYQDVIRVLGHYASNKRVFPRNGLERFQPEVERYVSALKQRAIEIEEFREACSREQRQRNNGKSDPWGPELVAILQKPELDSPKDDDFIIDWICREDVTPEIRENSAVTYLNLMFTHTAWRVGENAAALIATLAAQTHSDVLASKILTQLRKTLSKLSPDCWRAVLGTSEACFLSRPFAKTSTNGRNVLWIEEMIMEYHAHPNCDVRGLLVENVAFLAKEKFMLAKSKNDFRDVVAFLNRHNQEINFWLIDTDIWVLEHVYQLFREVNKHLASCPVLSEWKESRLAPLENSNCLLAKLGHGNKEAWLKMERGKFLEDVQRLQRLCPYAPA